MSTLEAGYRARSLSDHQPIVEWLTSAFTPLVTGATAQRVAVELQAALWRAGLGRAVGVIDLEHPATAMEHDAVVLHYDSDVDVMASVDEREQAR